jgi:HD-like signal output (HDOD) protein
MGWLRRWFAPRRKEGIVRNAAPDTPDPPDDPAGPPTESTAVSETSDAAEPEFTPEAWWLPRTPDTSKPTLSLAPEAVNTEHVAALERAIQDPDFELPVLTSVVQRAMVMLSSEDVDFQRLAAVVAEDQGVAAEVLRTVNSTAYARMFKYDRLDVAFTRLGQEKLKSIFYALSVKRLAIGSGSGQRTLGQELWQAAVVSGAVVSAAGRHFELPEEQAFLVGLFHDLGKLAILSAVPQVARQRGIKIGRSVFEHVCARQHEQLGARLAEFWRLPDPLPEVIGDHHHLVAPDEPVNQYRLLVQLADVICSLLEYTPYAPVDLFSLPVAQSLGLRDDGATRDWLSRLPGEIAERTGVL